MLYLNLVLFVQGDHREFGETDVSERRLPHMTTFDGLKLTANPSKRDEVSKVNQENAPQKPSNDVSLYDHLVRRLPHVITFDGLKLKDVPSDVQNPNANGFYVSMYDHLLQKPTDDVSMYDHVAQKPTDDVSMYDHIAQKPTEDVSMYDHIAKPSEDVPEDLGRAAANPGCIDATSKNECLDKRCDKDGDGDFESPCVWNDNGVCQCAPEQPEAPCAGKSFVDCIASACDSDGDGSNDRLCIFDPRDTECKCPPKMDPRPQDCLSATSPSECLGRTCDKDGDGRADSPCVWNIEQASCHCAPPRPSTECGGSSNPFDCAERSCDADGEPRKCAWKSETFECACPPKEEKCEDKNAFDCHSVKCDLDGDGVNDTRCKFDFSDGQCKCSAPEPQPKSCGDATTPEDCPVIKCDQNGDGINDMYCGWNDEQNACMCPPKQDTSCIGRSQSECRAQKCDADGDGNDDSMCLWLNNECACPPVDHEKCENKSPFDCDSATCDVDGDGVKDTRCAFDFSDNKCKCGREPTRCDRHRDETSCHYADNCENDGLLSPCVWLANGNGGTCACGHVEFKEGWQDFIKFRFDLHV